MKPPLDAEHLKGHLHKASEEARTFRREVVEKMSALATAAFGLVAALAWNNAIQAIFARFYKPNDPSAIWPLIGYAALVTVVGVLIILWIGRIAARLKSTEPLIRIRRRQPQQP